MTPQGHRPASAWRGKTPLLLASASPARARMLRAAGVPVEAIPAPIDERAVEAPLLAQGAAAERVALALAQAKAGALASTHPARWILGADQILVCEGEILHKPAGFPEAEAQIARLAGRTHRLISAAVLWSEGRAAARLVTHAELTMRPFTAAAIARYVAAAGPDILTCVGAYQLEGLGVQLFERVEGDYFTILGLPLLPLLAEMRRLELLA